MTRKLILLLCCCFVTLFVQGKDGVKLRSLVFDAHMYYDGMECSKFSNGPSVTYHTNDGYKSFVQDIEYSSDYSSVLSYYVNPAGADIQGYSFKIDAYVITKTNPRTRNVQKVDYSSLFNIENDKIKFNESMVSIPVKISKENKEKIKFNPKHQILVLGVKANNDDNTDITNTDDEPISSNYVAICFETKEQKPLDISFNGISWWDEEGDYSIDLSSHIFQVSEEKIDDIKDSIVVKGNDEHPITIHKVSTDANGITKCCVSVEDSSERIYGYTYVNVKFLPKPTSINQLVVSDADKKDDIYNILGQKIRRVNKGLYIKNRKVYFKK